MRGYNDEDIESLLKGVYNGNIDEYNLPKGLYLAIANYLANGMYKGFGGTLDDFSGKDLELLQELRDNIYIFSAAKTFNEVLDIKNKMFDEDGNLLSMNDFKKVGRDTFDNWNDNWGDSEYLTAVGQASMARKWVNIEENASVLPMLVFDTQGNPCPKCAPYDKFAAPVNDPIWSWLMPLLHFRCECTVRQEDEDYPPSNAYEYSQAESRRNTIPDVFQMNPGKDRMIFNNDYPYFKIAPKYEPMAKQNFGLPIPHPNSKENGK